MKEDEALLEEKEPTPPHEETTTTGTIPPTEEVGVASLEEEEQKEYEKEAEELLVPEKGTSIPKPNKKKIQLILLGVSTVLLLAIIFSLSKTSTMEEKEAEETQNQANMPPSDFAVKAEDRKRLSEEEEQSNESYLAEYVGQSNAIPQEYNDVRGNGSRRGEDGIYRDEQPLLAEYAYAQENQGEETTTPSMYVKNWEGQKGGSGNGNARATANALEGLLQQTQGGNDAAVALANAQNQYLTQNAQERKKNFLKQAQSSTDDGILFAQVRTPVSPYTITAGSIIPITMITGINSDLPGDIVGQVNRNVYDSVTGNYLLIPAGSKVVGKYDSGVTWGQKRVLVVWSRLVLPNGSSINLRGMQGIDLDGFSGYSDKIDAHVGEIIGVTLASTILNIGTGQLSALSSQQKNAYVQSLTSAVSGGAKNAQSIIDEIAKKIINLQPTLQIRKGVRAGIFIGKDVVLKPYIRRL